MVQRRAGAGVYVAFVVSWISGSRRRMLYARANDPGLDPGRPGTRGAHRVATPDSFSRPPFPMTTERTQTAVAGTPLPDRWRADAESRLQSDERLLAALEP